MEGQASRACICVFVFVCRGNSCLIKVTEPHSQAAVNEFSLRVCRTQLLHVCKHTLNAGNLQPGALTHSTLINKHTALPPSRSRSPTVTSVAACCDWQFESARSPHLSHSSQYWKYGLVDCKSSDTSFLNSIPPCRIHHLDKHWLSSLSTPTTCGFEFPKMNGAILPPTVS